MGVGLLLEGIIIVVEERDEAAGRPKKASEPQPLRPRQRHPAKQAEDTPFGLFVAENVQLVACQKHWRSPTRLERRTEATLRTKVVESTNEPTRPTILGGLCTHSNTYLGKRSQHVDYNRILI